ncbi:hypothetical protein FIBSPDRAFT_860431 [Athelia psychrophila]|uniref:Uncharacterized protein n=1 Tax=Athelia psychrophila TaxID=1759441 RepID=A0A166K410_9AGAM|nr:hypothetical protein FIBSPDRAFT_860431 [Fibularhizoctonia sp. CBS 109695]
MANFIYLDAAIDSGTQDPETMPATKVSEHDEDRTADVNIGANAQRKYPRQDSICTLCRSTSPRNTRPSAVLFHPCAPHLAAPLPAPHLPGIAHLPRYMHNIMFATLTTPHATTGGFLLVSRRRRYLG